MFILFKGIIVVEVNTAEKKNALSSIVEKSPLTLLRPASRGNAP